MKRHSDKMFYKKVVTELLKKVFIKKDKKFIFSYYDYDKGRIELTFVLEEDKEKDPLRDKVLGIRQVLYSQHYNNYDDTLDLVYGGFDSIENI